MTPNNNLNPLAFYKSQNDMFRARPYNYGIKYPLYMPLNRVTPFQIIRGLSESTTLTSAKIYNDRGVEVATVTSYMSVNVVTIGASKVMQFKCGNYANLTPGQYTMRVVIGNDTYYSEVFTAYANIGKLVKVEYYNADPIIFDEGALTYDNGFKFELYLCTEIAKPEYLFEEESTKRGGFTFVENQISSKQYKMVIAAPEYLCDAIRIIRLHDHVAITKDGNAYEAYNFTPSYQWNDVGDLAQVTITFESNTVLQKISAYKGSQSVFKNALLAAASVPIMFSPNVIAQYGASVDGVAEAYTEFTGKLIRQLEEQTTLPKQAWVAIDTGTGEAKKMSIGLLGGGTGKPSELWTNDKKIKYLYIKEDNSEAYITKQFIGDSNIMAKGDIVAYQSGNWDLVTPTAGYDTLGMARFNSSDFTIDNGLVGLKVGAVGQRYYAGKGLSLASINGGTDNQFNVVFGELENTVMQGNDARFLKLYNGTWWGQAFDKSTGIVKGAMTSVDSINTLVYFNTDKSILVTKNKSAEGIKFSGGNSINGVYGSATNNLYLNYTDATHNVKIDANHNIFANGDIVAYASGNYDISKPLAGYDAVGMSRYDKTQFEVVNGLVRIIDSGGGGTIAGIEITGNGNAFTNASMKSDNTVISFDKGITFWHAGNDGNGSGLDADLLDGWHRDDIRQQVKSFAVYGANSDGLYDANIAAGGGMIRNYDNYTKWTNTPSGMTYGAAICFKAYNSSSLFGMLAWDINHDSTTDVTRKLYWRTNGTVNGVIGTWGKWHEVAFADGNVASATKLQTMRTIWGQNFNGTQNVSGNMTGVGHITMTGNINMNNGGTIYMKDNSGNLAEAIRFNSVNELIVGNGSASKSADLYLSGNNVHIRTSLSFTERVKIASNGNVGIGTNSPIFKLEIKGASPLLGFKADGTANVSYTYIEGYHANNGTTFRIVESTSTDLWLQYGKNSVASYNFHLSGYLNTRLKEFNVNSIDSIFSGNVKAGGDVVAYQSGTWDIVKPIAGKDALGMIKVGSGLSIDVNGVLSSTGGGGGTIAGIEITGNGNAFTNASMKSDNTVISFDKGITFWHAGNDGNGSGLDADLLDGWHRDDIRQQVKSFAVYGANSDGLYDANIAAGGGMIRNYDNYTKWTNTPSGMTYGAAICFKAYNSSSLFGMLAWDINHDSTTDVTRKLYWRTNGTVNGVIGTWGKWHEIAFTDGNVASATKLQTARTIWGQSFNGTANVSGNMTGVGSITMSGNIYMGNNRNIYAKNPDGSDMAIFYTNTNSELVIGTGNAQKGTNTFLSGYEIIFRTSTSLEERMKIASNGNVGIGASDPGEKLEVNGHIKCGHVYPRANNTYNVGLTGTRFSNGYFINGVYVGDANTSFNSNSSNTFINRGSIELNASTPYIDFHYNNSTSDYTHRIIAQSGNLQITPSVSIGGSCYPTNSTTCMLGTSSLRWVRLYLTGINGNWISGKTDGAIMIDSTSTSTSTYFPLYRWKTYTGRVFNLGGLQGADSSHQFGFYMFDKDQTENRTNASFYMYSNGNMNGTHSLIMQQDVVAYGSSSYNITSPTAGYDALGLARFDSTYFTVSSGYVTLKASATSPIRSVTATTLNPGSNANASWNSSTGALSLGIPRGNTGATGTQGASVTYQWSGTSLRMGVTPYGGSTAWGSYVNLKGATGSPGPSWNGGEVTNNITIKATWGALGLSGGTNNFYLSQRGDNIVYFCFGGTNNNKGSFSPSGNMYVSGSYSNGSDIRLKYRLEDISDILGKIKDISAFYYIRKDLNDGVIRIGVSAQDVIKQFPQVVSNNSINGKEYYSVEYATLGVAIAVNGLKEVHQLVQDNKNEIDLLKIEIASLKERLAKLEAA